MHVLRYGLVGLIAWLAVFKFTATEANAIVPLLANSPLLSWLLAVTDARGASRVIGSIEILVALLIASRPLSPLVSAAGSLAAVGMFLTTLSFLVTTPGMWVRVEGLIVPSGGAAFIVKDIFLLGAAMITAAEALRATLDRERAVVPT